MEFGERLAFERKRLGLKQPEFAVACGMSGQMQSLYETGKRSPDAEYLMAACKLGADPAFLLMGRPSHPSTLQVSDDDAESLVAFHGLSPKARAAMMRLVAVVKEEK